MSRAAVNNEGKLHFGYIFAGDASLATARMMIRGALAFGPFLERHLGMALDRFELSSPFAYLFHRDSQRSIDDMAGYLKAVHGLIAAASDGRPASYFGRDLRRPPRRWPVAEREAAFDPSLVLDAYDTEEIAVEPRGIARAVRERIAATPAIELHLGRILYAVEAEGGRFRVLSDGPAGPEREAYSDVVNALWDGRLAIDATMGLRPAQPWLFRCRYGVLVPLPAGLPRPPSVTIMHGTFGDTVSYDGGGYYLSWYPVCKRASSAGLLSPEFPVPPPQPLRACLIEETHRMLAGIIPALGDWDRRWLEAASVSGGVIFAHGSTDIDDPMSGLHRRHEIGIFSTGRYHSVDPGKLTMVPYFAERCAERIAPATHAVAGASLSPARV
jgi:hypothetical protein